MNIIIWNRFPEYYVVSENSDSFDGLDFHFHGTEQECKQYIKDNEH